MKSWLGLIFLGLFVGTQLYGAPKKLYPIDEASQNPDFMVFRDQLLKASQKKDLQFLKRIIDPKIEWSFGDGPGSEGFIREWDLNNPKSLFWKELITILQLGGTFDGDKKCFTAPYVFERFPEQYDAFDYAAIVGSDVTMHKAPDVHSPRIAKLSYDIVKYADQRQPWHGGTFWVRVQTLNHQEGYVWGEFVRSPIAHRTEFCKEGDRWMMKYFIAGD